MNYKVGSNLKIFLVVVTLLCSFHEKLKSSITHHVHMFYFFYHPTANGNDMIDWVKKYVPHFNRFEATLKKDYDFF